MSGSKEEKEKCLEKLNRMQKYLPFLDFMIDKIKKKNNESSLKCQLSKFQVLRSMIAEKNGKYTWNEIVKVEDVIKKLISKLDFKGQYVKSRENSPKSDKQNYKANMATSNTKAPPPTVSVTTPSFQTTTADIRSQEIPTNTVELIMKTLKVSTDINMRKTKERGQQLLSSSLVLNQPLEVPGKSKETDLDKDLDGFDLTDSESSNSVIEVFGADPSPAPAPVLTAAPAPALTHSDLLSSSREKLLKSLQNRLLLSKGDLPSQKPFAVGRSEKMIESHSISASSRSHGVFSEIKSSSDFSESTDNSAVDRGKIKTVDTVDVIPGKPIPTPSKATKPFSLSEKIRSDPPISVGIDNLKQKLKEKFSTDICELYRVPGKSVGGSLRSLNKVKSHKKSFVEEEDDLFKPDKVTEKSDPKRTNASQSKFCPEKKDDLGNNKNKNGKTASWKGEASSGKTDDKVGDKSSKSKTQKSESSKYERSLRKEKKQSSKGNGEGKILELDKLNDDELLEFVKENTKSLPHLAKLKPLELRKAIQTSAVKASLDLDSVSEISDDSFYDFDEKSNSESKMKFKSNDIEKKCHPLASVKIAQIDSDGVAKNIKPITELSKDAKVLDEIGDKTHDMDLSEDFDEEEYAQRLIEETTPKIEPVKPVKKKGLLELPLPIVNDLFDDISSIESFETLNSSPNESADSRRTLPKCSEKTTTKNTSESTHQPSADQSSSKPIGGGRSGSFVRDNPQPSKDYNLSARVQTNIGPIPESQKSWDPPSIRTNQNRSDPRPSKSLAGHSSQDMTQHPQLSNQHIIEPGGGLLRGHSKPPGNPSVNILRRHSCGSVEPRSYAEYKRLKQVKSSQQETNANENTKSITSDSSPASEISKSPAERDAPETALPTAKKCLDTRKTKDPHSKQTIPRNHHSGVGYDEKRRLLNAGQRRHSDHMDSRKSCEETGKIGEEKRKSTESEESVSPLEKLYESERKPQTGRGYGLQHFKIPKKVRETVSQCPSKPNESHMPLDEPKTSTSSSRSEADSSKDSKEPVCISIDLENNDAGTTVEERSKKTGEKLEKDNPVKGTEKTESDKTVTKTESSITESDSTSHEAALESNETETAGESVPNPEKDVTKSGSVKTPPQKCEAQIAECDSSMENPGVCERNVREEKTPPGDKSATVSKEEITQEFVEALIRKSFQSGEGKLLLAHAKLFEEFAKKLNSKKLKTIQRIINSETDSSSSSTEVFSEDERKKKKGKKSEERIQKNKRPRRKGKKGRRHKSLSSSSSLSSESEESSEEECCDKKEEKHGKKQRDEAVDDEDSRSQQRSAADESKSKNPDSVPAKGNKRIKKRRKYAEFGKNFSGTRAKRKQQQKKLLERILNETPEASPDRNASNPKESERKTRPRTKGKVRSELDRLHDDIRNMFLNEGVVTPTGQRMCRILKQSGGNMTNLDIVKESAKMVEEEKLKAHTVRSYGKKSRGGNADSSDSRSSSQSLDKTSKAQQEGEEGVDPKLTMSPRVVLQKVDLNNFGYAMKLSDNCISFKRMRGKNTAIKSMSSQRMHSKARSEYKLLRNVFLPRNKRKVKRMREAKCKKEYEGKRLADVVKNLPLKMAKMKHLQICEKKMEQPEEMKRRKCTSGRSPKKSAFWKNKSDLELSNAELLRHAFEKIRVMYSCKLCSHVTRYITGHYKVAHPDHEVLISRLCVGEAKRAKLEAKKNKYNISASKGNPTPKRKMTTPNSSNLYNCRMCASMKTEDLEVFKAHVSSHTGEYRFQCPAEECSTKTYSFVDIKLHILNKHGKNRTEYNKVTELYNIVVEEDKMFGFLCSICNYVQLCRDNVAEHFSRRHAITEKPEIIKINMSANPSRGVRKKSEKIHGEKETSKSGENNEKLHEESGGKLKKTGQGENSEGERENQDGDVNMPSPKEKTRVLKNAKVKKENKDEAREEEVDGEDEEVEDEEGEEEEEEAEEEEKMEIEEEMKVEERKDEVKKQLFNATSEEFSEKSSERKDTGVELAEISQEADNAGENRMDLENISPPETGEIRGSVESSEDGNRRVVGVLQKLKVGPLEAQLLVNSSVLYECYVKGCLFFTQTFNLFEKHIKISHCNTEWDGICEICNAGKDAPPSGDNSFKLLTALRHLKLHEREKLSDGKFSKEELIRELKLLNSSEKFVIDDEETDKTENDAKNPLETNEEEQKMTENADPPFPPKPLLRVRSLLGDRLSTPKESPEDNEVVPITETPTPLESQPKSMFTIENVRSLNEAPSEDSEIQIEHVCSLKDSPKPLPPLAPGKTILVRSCPTRKIAIRPETSALSIDVGQLSVVQTPPPTHPVVLAPLTTTAPIRIISSSALSPRPKFTVKPIFVSADPGRISTSNVLSIIRPTMSPVVPTAPATTEPKSAPQTPVIPESSSANHLLSSSKPLEVKVNSPPPQSKSAPPAPSSTGVVDVENLEENDSASLQKIYPSPNAGNKRVKDAKIYEEMLTKTKLCHLFKCMGIECSFTCNDECVFRQHIGLHEAQRRLKKNKGIRTIFLRLANKTTRAFYWQQCAYCCELLTNTNNALSQHVLEEHGHCMYQCAFCFYRAVSHSYVEIHQNLAHGQVLKTTPRVIYKCKPLRPPPSQVAALIKHGRRQCVRPYHCDQCGRKFFITQDFIKHLTTQHQSVTAYTCHICKNLCFKADRLVVHYKLHSYCTYQCAYCLHGTETEKEMVFHLCNFHFSQPAIMYMRAFADGQSHEVKEKQTKMKKHLRDQLDSLKVIVYESDTLSLDCIVEVDADEETSGNASDVTTDLSSIVAELGINTDVQSQQSCVTPLMKELASIGDRNTNNLTVKTLLPNAEFSSENENGTENCSVLISSGLSTPTDESNEKAMNIPLGQLPLEAVSVQHKEAINVSSTPDKSLKLSEIIENIHIKDKAVVAVPNPDDKIQPAVISSAIHKLPPVVLSRTSASKNVYSSKSSVVKKKSEEAIQPKENVEGVKVSSSEAKEGGRSQGSNAKDTTPGEGSVKTSGAKAGAEEASEKNEKSLGEPPIISSVVSLCTGVFEKESAGSLISSPVVISGVGSPGILLNIQPKVTNPALKPPIIRVEDFPIGEENKEKSVQKTPVNPEPEKKDNDEKSVTADAKRASSPDIIILEEEKPNDIITVTLDSDDEKEENTKKETDKVEKSEDEVSKSSVGGNVIRKEMELLRNQIANETDSLLFDEEEVEKKKVKKDLLLSIDPVPEESSTKQSLLSPIEEAICSLNKKLQSETEQAQKKEEEKKESVAEVSPSKAAESSPSELPKRPMTRFAARDRKKEGGESGEKSDGDDSSIKKESPGKCKKPKEDLVGKTLFICGNENCNFAANDDVELKDHLYVCDLSRESSMLVCPHCSRQIKQFHSYLEHLRYHGPKKYHCGLCDYSSAGESSVTRHVKQKHKCSFVKVLPKESQPGHMAYYPKNYKVEKVDFEANGYSPGDEDKLPLQSVYQVNVKCAKCPYFTKVRSNMVRHLKIHVKSVETEGVVVVPSTAPTNPVPCLETKERMFDKMTNLAASSQLAQAKEKAVIESLSSEEAAKLPQFIAEQMRYKCCLPDCNYITVDDGMLKHHIKALHDEINYYSCPHCQSTVHVDVRHVTLDKIGHHLKHHDVKLYKCAHCIFFHYQKNVVEKHTAEKHPDRRYFVHTVREPKPETALEEEPSSTESGPRMWKCGLCENYRTPSKPTLRDHLLKNHNIKSKYRCQLCPMKGNSYQAFLNHFSSKHPGEKVSFTKVYLSEKGSLESGNSSGADSSSDHFDTTPLWQRGTPRIRHIRGILIEEEEIKTKKMKRTSLEESEAETSEEVRVDENAFSCPLCTNKKKPFFTRSEDCFRTHLYQELNYQQFACILCGKMFVDRKDFDRHHARVHPDKSPAVKQTKEDHEIKFWVDQVIARRRQEMENRKRKLGDGEGSGNAAPPKKKKEV